jgi:hypothetical protein
LKHALHYLVFDASDDGADFGTWEAMASVRASERATRLPAVEAEAQAVIDWATRHPPGRRGPLDDGGAWDADLDIAEDGDWLRVTLVITGPIAWGEALVARFNPDD